MIKTLAITLLGLVMNADAVQIRNHSKARVADPMREAVDGIIELLDTSGDGLISEQEYR